MYSIIFKKKCGKFIDILLIIVFSDDIFPKMLTVLYSGIILFEHYMKLFVEFFICWKLTGFPIPNDPIYSGSVWGPNGGKGGNFGKSEEQVMSVKKL